MREQTLRQYERYEKFPSQRLNQAREGYTKIADFIVRYVQAGGIPRAGSDPNNGLPALGLHQEVVMFVEAGVSPMQAIQAATIIVARRSAKTKTLAPLNPEKSPISSPLKAIR